MPLPSQSGRTPGSTPVRANPSRGGPKSKMNWTPMVLIFGGVGAVIVLAWLALRPVSGSGGSRGGATPTPAVVADGGTGTGAGARGRPTDVLGTLSPGGGGGTGTLGGSPVVPGGSSSLTSPGSGPGISPPTGTPGPREAETTLGNTPGGPGGGAAVPVMPAASPERSLSPVASLPTDLQDMLGAARSRLASGDAVAARVLLTRAMRDARLPEAERVVVRDDLTRINEDLVFSPRVDAQDPFAYAYTIRPGDSLVRIDQREKLGPDWRFIQRVNRMANPGQLSVGRTLKLVRGPFHAVVSKSAYRMDVYMGPTDRPEEWVYVRSFAVGLGESDTTPIGEFVVRRGSKLVNPHWVNPRTGQRFDANDPLNPIGEHWIGLEGLGPFASITGYGIHGTIEPGSIGQQRSMGCVRLGAEDVALVYELLGEGVSRVNIVP